MIITTDTAKQTVKKLLKEDPDRTLYLVTLDVKIGKQSKIKNYIFTIYDDYKKLRKSLKASILNAECLDNYTILQKQLKKYPLVHNFSCNDPITEEKTTFWITITKVN